MNFDHALLDAGDNTVRDVAEALRTWTDHLCSGVLDFDGEVGAGSPPANDSEL